MKGKAPELPSIIRGGEGSKTEMANQELGKKAFYASEDKVKRAQALAAKGNVGAIKLLST